MSDCRFGVSPVNYPDPDPEGGNEGCYIFQYPHEQTQSNRLLFSILVFLL